MSGESTEPPAMDELDRLIFAGREGLTIEFKSGMSWTEASTKAKVVKAALAMAVGGVIDSRSRWSMRRSCEPVYRRSLALCRRAHFRASSAKRRTATRSS